MQMWHAHVRQRIACLGVCSGMWPSPSPSSWRIKHNLQMSLPTPCHSLYSRTVDLERNDGKIPNGVTSYPCSRGRCLVWDATVVDTFRQPKLIESAINPFSAANRANDINKVDWRTAIYFSAPCLWKYTDIMGSSTWEFVNILDYKLSVQNDEMRETTWLKERISSAIGLPSGRVLIVSQSSCVSASTFLLAPSSILFQL